jgi:GntR family transcriptional regulator
MITVRLDADMPLEEQIYQEIRRAVAWGHVAAGQELPPVRQLGGDLGVHWNTVARAYRRLRDEGLLSIGQGRGVIVRAADASRRRPAAFVHARVAQKLDDALTEARLGGLASEQVREMFERKLETLDPGEEAR